MVSGACASALRLPHKKKHTKSENLPPHAPQSSGFYLLSLFSPGAYLPFPGGCRAAKRPSGRERHPDAPQEGASISAMRPVKSAQEGTFVWFGARRARKFKFSAFFCMAEVSGQELQSYTYYRPIMVAAQRELSRVRREVQRRHAYEDCPQKLDRTDPRGLENRV